MLYCKISRSSHDKKWYDKSGIQLASKQHGKLKVYSGCLINSAEAGLKFL